MKELQRMLAPGEESDELTLALLRSGQEDAPDEASRMQNLALLGASVAVGGLAAKVGLAKWLWAAGAGKWLNVLGMVAVSAGSIGVYAVVQSLREPAHVQTMPAAPAVAAMPSAAARSPEPTPTVAATAIAPVETTPTPAAAPTIEIAPTTKGAASSAAPASSVMGTSAAKLGLSDEIARLDDARRALARGDANTTLVLLDRYDREPAAHALSQEASMLRIEALVALGRRDEARRHARRLLAANSGTAYEDRVRSLLGDLP